MGTYPLPRLPTPSPLASLKLEYQIIQLYDQYFTPDTPYKCVDIYALMNRRRVVTTCLLHAGMGSSGVRDGTRQQRAQPEVQPAEVRVDDRREHGAGHVDPDAACDGPRPAATPLLHDPPVHRPGHSRPLPRQLRDRYDPPSHTHTHTQTHIHQHQANNI